MGKPKPPPPPDYTPVAAANEKVAKMNIEFAQEQLQWAKDQYDYDYELTDRIVSKAEKQMDYERERQEEQAGWARDDRARYEEKFQPLENEMIEKGRKYQTEEYQNLQAGKAQADVSMQFAQAREAAQDQLESFGVDPTQTRSQALDLSMRVQEAAARAGAGNAARDSAEAKGLAITGDMINIGKGYPGQITAAMAGSTASGQNSLAAGNSAVNSRLANTQVGAQSMGTAPQFMGAANTAIGNWGQLLNGIYGTQMEGYKARLNASSGIGGAIGGVVGTIAGLSDERAKENIAEVGETADGQPIYSYNYKGDPEPRMGLMAQDVEKRDPEAVHTGEDGLKRVDYDRALEKSKAAIELDDDTVRWHGEKFFQDLKRKAAEGRAQAIPT